MSLENMPSVSQSDEVAIFGLGDPGTLYIDIEAKGAHWTAEPVAPARLDAEMSAERKRELGILEIPAATEQQDAAEMHKSGKFLKLLGRLAKTALHAPKETFTKDDGINRYKKLESKGSFTKQD